MPYTNRRQAVAKIAKREPFRGNNLHGDTCTTSVGILPKAWAEDYYADLSKIDYVVWSYATPIAWHIVFENGESVWIVPPVKYSVSTTQHQGVVRQALTYAELADADIANADHQWRWSA